MKIVVCIKQVPNTTEVRLDPKTNTLIREGAPSIINSDDKVTIETALKIEDQDPGTHVAVLSMGPPQAEDALREALAMGAGEAILLTDRIFGGAGIWTTSCTVTGTLETIGNYDLIIADHQAIDGGTAQAGPQVAEHLNIPQVTYAEDLSVNGNTVTVKHQFEDRYHIIDVKTPRLVTALTELAEPRYMTVDGVFDAYEHDLKIRGLDDTKEHLDLANIGLKDSPTKVKRSYPKQGKSASVKLENLSPEEAAHAIIARMRERYIIQESN